MVRWRRLILVDPEKPNLEKELRLTCETLRSHSAKTFHLDEDNSVVRVEGRIMGDPCMVLLRYKTKEEKDKVTGTLLAEGFLWEEIVVEPDF